MNTNSIIIPEFVDARVAPRGSLENLSQEEIAKLLDTGQGGLYPLFRKCALAVLNSGSDDRQRQGDLRALPGLRHRARAPGLGHQARNEARAGQAFVDGEMIRGIKEHLFAVLRDVIYIANEIIDSGRFDLTNPGCDHQCRVPHPAQCARARVQGPAQPGGVLGRPFHRRREEYQYTKRVGYELGLRGLDVCTGCGPGAMKGPMKGATIGHAKQRIARAATSASPSPASSPPNRPIPSSTSW